MPVKDLGRAIQSDPYIIIIQQILVDIFIAVFSDSTTNLDIKGSRSFLMPLEVANTEHFSKIGL